MEKLSLSREKNIESIKADITKLKEVLRIKGTSMLGFLNTFSVNFEIHNYYDIGNSVSREFGTVIRLVDESIMEDNIIYHDKELVGLTILHAKKFLTTGGLGSRFREVLGQ